MFTRPRLLGNYVCTTCLVVLLGFVLHYINPGMQFLSKLNVIWWWWESYPVVKARCIIGRSANTVHRQIRHQFCWRRRIADCCRFRGRELFDDKVGTCTDNDNGNETTHHGGAYYHRHCTQHHHHYHQFISSTTVQDTIRTSIQMHRLMPHTSSCHEHELNLRSEL